MANQIPKIMAMTLIQAPIPKVKGKMDEPGKDSMNPALSAMSASSLSSGRGFMRRLHQ